MNKKDFFKQKAIYIILGCAALLTLFCIVRMIMPKQTYHYSSEKTFESGVEETDATLYEQIALPLGVYDFEIEYQTDTNMTNLFSVTDGTVFTNGLLTNGEHTYANLDSAIFRVWLFENTEALRVSIGYGGVGSIVVGDLTVRETNALWTMLLTIVWSLTFVLVALLVFQKWDRTIGVEKEKKTIFVGLLMIILIASLPYLQGGIMDGADIIYHLQRIEGVQDGILSGQFPLRLEPEWLYGYGYANSIFYCNTLLYLPAVFRLLGFTISTCYNLYCIVLNIATAWIAYLCFARIFKNRYIGLICSALYTLSIFRIYKLVITAALGEGSAVTFMPLVLYGFYRAFTEDVKAKAYKTVWIPIAVGYAGLLQTHVLSCEITAFLTILVCLVFIKKIFIKQTFMELAKGALAAIAMSCWYLVPFLDYYMNEDMHIRHVSARTIQDRGLYIPQLFFNWWKLGDNALSGDQGMQASHAMGIGLVLGIAFVIFIILWFSGKFRHKESIMSLGKTSCIFGGMLMLMSLNFFPWDAIQQINEVTAALVSSLQFPNRFLGWGTVFLVTLSGCLLWYFKTSGKKWYFYPAVVVTMVGLATSSIYLLDYVCRDKAYIHLYNEEGMGYGYISGKEYIVEGTETDDLWYDDPTASEEVEIVGYEKEYLHMWVACTNTQARGGYIELPLLHYNGYRAYVTSTGEELPTEKGTNNLVRVTVPAGFDGEIEIKFVSPLHWRLSEAVTYIWYSYIVVSGIRQLCRKQREKRENRYA